MPKIEDIKESDIEEGNSELEMRRGRGEDAITEGSGMDSGQEEDETRASDAISNILTALFGASGFCVQDAEGWDVHHREFQLNEARRFIEGAFESWLGDAEDYCVPMPEDHKARLEELRAVLRAENMSYGELAELQGLAAFIDEGDVELLEAAGVPEYPEDNPETRLAELQAALDRETDTTKAVLLADAIRKLRNGI